MSKGDFMERTTETTKIDEAKKKIPTIVAKLTALFNLQEWSYTIKFEKTLPDEAAANCNVDEEYLYFKIGISEESLLLRLKEDDYEEIIDWLVHELVHVLIDPLYFIAADAMANTSFKFLTTKREQAVTRITNIIMKGLNVEKIWG